MPNFGVTRIALQPRRLAAALTASLLLTTFAAPAIAAAAPKSPAAVAPQTTVTLSWQLFGATGKPLAAHPVAVLKRSKGAVRWQPLRDMRTDRQGRITLTAPVVVNSEFAMRYGGTTPANGTIISRPLVVDVASAVTTALSASRARRGTPVSVRGAVTPGRLGLVVELQSLTPRGWRTILATRTDAKGRYVFAAPTAVRGVSSFRVLRRADAYNTAGHSRTVVLRVS